MEEDRTRGTWNDGWFGGYYVWSHRFQNMIILVRFCVEIKQ